MNELIGMSWRCMFKNERSINNVPMSVANQSHGELETNRWKATQTCRAAETDRYQQGVHRKRQGNQQQPWSHSVVPLRFEEYKLSTRQCRKITSFIFSLIRAYRSSCNTGHSAQASRAQPDHDKGTLQLATDVAFEHSSALSTQTSARGSDRSVQPTCYSTI